MLVCRLCQVAALGVSGRCPMPVHSAVGAQYRRVMASGGGGRRERALVSGLAVAARISMPEKVRIEEVYAIQESAPAGAGAVLSGRAPALRRCFDYGVAALLQQFPESLGTRCAWKAAAHADDRDGLAGSRGRLLRWPRSGLGPRR